MYLLGGRSFEAAYLFSTYAVKWRLGEYLSNGDWYMTEFNEEKGK